MGEWLGDTPTFQKSMSESERKEFENFKKGTTMPKNTIPQPVIADFPSEFTDETKTAPKTAARKPAAKKEKTMPKKTAAKTVPAKTERKPRLSREEWKAQYIAGLEAKAEELGKKHEGDELDAPVNLYHKLNAERTGEPAKNLYASDLEAKVLALTCIENGWPTADFLSRNQAAEYGGTPKDGAKGIKLHGKYVARGYTYVNAAEIDWAEGEPVWKDDVAKEHAANYAQRNAEWKAKKAQEKADKLAKAAGKTTKKEDNAELKALKKENAKLKKDLKSIAENQESTAAVLAALVAKLGL